MTITNIGVNAFSGCTNLVIYGYKGSAAETYAEQYNIPFVELEQPGVEKATVTIKGFFGQSETREFNVGDEFTVYTTLNCKDIGGGYIGSLKGEQQYTASILENIDEKEVRSGGTYFKNLDLIFPTNIDNSGENKTTSNAGISGRIPYIASSPEFAEKAFSYNNDGSLLIVTKYKVTAPGYATVTNTMRTIALADHSLTRVVEKI